MAQISIFAGNFAPQGWALCQGALMLVSQNQALFSLLGTIYGGDGRTTFALPDLRGRIPVGVGQGPGLNNINQGHKGGSETAQMTVQNMPTHSHTPNLKIGTTTAAPQRKYLPILHSASKPRL